MDNGLVIFDWFVPSMRMQVILDCSIRPPGFCPYIRGGKKGEFRNWTKRHLISPITKTTKRTKRYLGIENYNPNAVSRLKK